MARKPDAPCTICGTLMWSGSTTAANPICRPCRAARPKAPRGPRVFKGECSEPECDRPVLARGLCPTHYSYWHRAQRKHTITCAECGKTVKAARAGTHCSLACASLKGMRASGKEPRPWHRRRRQQSAARKLAKAQQGTVGKRVWMQGPCSACGEQFTPGATTSRYCDECATIRVRLKRDRRRARKRQSFVSPVSPRKVFESDGYRCHICGKKTDKTKTVPHPKAPTVDHLLPLSLGGTHEPANCRTACFLCNATKSDRLAGDQLMLLAV